MPSPLDVLSSAALTTEAREREKENIKTEEIAPAGEDEGVIRCVCDLDEDDGFTIQCERCYVWQHVLCLGIAQENVPEEYVCERCEPRWIDVEAAKARQAARKQAEQDMIAAATAVVTAGARQGALGGDSITTGAFERSGESSGAVPDSRNSIDSHDEEFKPSRTGSSKRNPVRSAVGGKSGIKRKVTLEKEDGGKKRKSTGNSNSSNNNNNSSSNIGSNNTNGTSNTTTNSNAVPATKNTEIISSTGGGASVNTEQRTKPGKRVQIMEADNMEIQPVNTSTIATSATPLHNKAAPNHAPILTSTSSPLANSNSARSQMNTPHLDKTVLLRAEEERAEAWQDEYTPIHKCRYASTEVLSRLLRVVEEEKILECSATDLKLPSGAAVGVRVVEDWAHGFVPSAVDGLSNSAYAGRESLYGVYTDPASKGIAADSYIGQVMGEVVDIEDYRSDPINQYEQLGLPKSMVRYIKAPWNIVIDQRLFGNEARFVRNGCHPNAIIRPMVIPQETAKGKSEERIVYALFTTASIGPHEEIILPWQWEQNHIVHALDEIFAKKFVDQEDTLNRLLVQMAAVVITLVGVSGGCACKRARNCAVAWMWKLAGIRERARGLSAAIAKAVRDAENEGSIDLGPLVGRRRR